MVLEVSHLLLIQKALVQLTQGGNRRASLVGGWNSHG
jgi:hypothetical protein